MVKLILLLINLSFADSTTPCSDLYQDCDNENCTNEYYQCLDDEIVNREDTYVKEATSAVEIKEEQEEVYLEE